MKIKLHKRFRGLLSLLVAVMLLVGVMPLSSVTVHAWSKQVTVYFAKRMGSVAIDGGDNTGIGFWGAEEGSGGYKRKKMNYVSNSKENTGYWIYSYTITFNNQNSYGLKFIQGGETGDEGLGTVDITGEDLIDGYLYYTKGTQGGKPLVEKMPFSDAYYKPLTSSDTFRATKDMNVIVDSSGTFKQNAQRHYVSATLYDYFSDYEIINGTTRTGGNQNNAVNAGITTTTMYSSWEDPLKRIHTLTFDKALSAVYGSNSYQHPLYFGDIHHEGDGYKFGKSGSNAGDDGFNEGRYWQLVRGSSYTQLYHDNNSSRRSGLTDTNEKDRDAATMGLYANSLTEYVSTNTNVQNAQRLKLAGGADAEWFDDTWLSAGSGNTHNSTGKMIGASYDVDFPFWTLQNLQRTIKIGSTERTYTGDYYYINSENASHALRLHKDTSGKYYLKETGEGIYNFSGNDETVLANAGSKSETTLLNEITTTYGFFPFNSKSDFYTGGDTSSVRNLMNYRLRMDRTNYCFGTYMVIPFTLTSNNGTVNGTTDATDTPITFSFSGDDDLLVYIDNQLVLDIGGNHGKVQGEINLKEKKSWVSKAKTSDGSGEATGVTWGTGTGSINDVQNITIPSSITNSGGVKTLANALCEKGDHVMEIFYVERGLFDSNMEIMYNLPVVENRSFTVGQSITTPTVDSVFTSSPNYNTNVSNIRLDMNVQFSEPNNTSTFDKLLDEQTYPGDNPKKITGITGVTEFDSNATTHTYSVKMGNNNTITYLNNFIKPYSYNLKVSEGNIFIKTGIDENGKEICTDTNRDVSHLFTTSWKLRQLSNAANEQTAQNAGPATTATATTSGSSRPKRATKTTSTSATNNSNGFDFRGTQANPDQIEFYNTMNTYSLRVSKEFHRKTDDTAERTFTIKVYFNNVGGLNLEEPNAATPAINDNNGLGIVLEKELTFTFSSSEGTGTDGATKYKDIVVPANTVYKVIETTDQTSNGYAKSGEVGADNDDPFAGPVLDENNRVSVTVVNRAPQAIILKVQKVWENTTSSTAFPASVKFLVEKSTDGAPFTSMTSGTVVNASGQAVSDDTLLDSSGYLTLTNAYTTTINGNTVWLAYIYDDDNVSTNTYRVTEYDGNTPLGEGATYKPTANSFKVKYSETGFTSESTYTNATETGLTRPSGVNADYGNGSPEGGRVLTLSVINRAFIKIRVQSYFTQADAEQQGATPSSVKMKVQRLNTSSGTWENVVNTESHSTRDVIATVGNVQPEANNRKYFEYILDGEYDPDYTYKVEEYSSSNDIVDGEGVTQFNNVFITVSYNGAGGVKPNQSTGDELDDSWTGVKGITLAIFNSADGSPGNTETGGRGGYIPIAGGFIAILLAGAGYFIYKKRIFA